MFLNILNFVPLISWMFLFLYVTGFCALSFLFNSDGLNDRIYFEVFFSICGLSFSPWVGLMNFELPYMVFWWAICRGSWILVSLYLFLSWSKLLLCSFHHFFRSFLVLFAEEGFHDLLNPVTLPPNLMVS